jgi:Zn-dependent metalloprotease
MIGSSVRASAALALAAVLLGAGTARAVDEHGGAAPAFVPPYVFEQIARNGTPEQRQDALRQLRQDRALLPGGEGQPAPAPRALLPRGIYNAGGGTALPGRLVWGGPPSPLPADPQVRQAAAGQGATIDFWKWAINRNLAVPATVHYDLRYNNAFWNGSQMVFGDGDGVLFNPFTCCIDVVGHERMHGITGNRMAYHKQSGALNESLSDVFGVLVVQFMKKQTAANASWLVGSGLFKPRVRGRALRDMANPGTAYNDPVLGRDPQPAHMSRYVNLPDTADGDWGGVHVNSGIPNKAFVLFARSLGGNAYGLPGNIWYNALSNSTYPANLTFAAFARVTIGKAQQLSGAATAAKLTQAWRAVVVTPVPLAATAAAAQVAAR